MDNFLSGGGRWLKVAILLTLFLLALTVYRDPQKLRLKGGNWIELEYEGRPYTSIDKGPEGPLAIPDRMRAVTPDEYLGSSP
jgi:hypothetical protein